jgi:DNA-directed RNA polymerase specialized sigma24 family protein
MSYKLSSGGVIRKEDGACIPATTDNVDWLAYQSWLALGNLPEAADPVPIADTATAFEERQRSTTLDQLDSAISRLPAAQQEPFRLVLQLLKE